MAIKDKIVSLEDLKAVRDHDLQEIEGIKEGTEVVGTADNLLSDSYTVSQEPYLLKPSWGARIEDTLVGGTVVWNQLVQNGNFANGITGWTVQRFTTSVSNNILTVTIATKDYHLQIVNNGLFIPEGHKYLVSASLNPSVAISGFTLRMNNINSVTYEKNLTANTWNEFIGILQAGSNSNTDFRLYCTNSNLTADSTLQVKEVNVIDLTRLFGSTIADYIYSLEQATAGAGVALAKKWAGIKGYIPYDAGSLKSVSNVSAHVMRDADDVVRATYPLDSSLTLRGITKLVDNQLVYDGDIYKADGSVQRRYAVVTFDGSSSTGWTYIADYGTVSRFDFVTTSPVGKNGTGANTNIHSNQFPVGIISTSNTECINIHGSSGYIQIQILTSKLSAKTPAGLMTYFAQHPLSVVYEVATPTTETTDPYESLQLVYDGGTEEYVTDSIPVGHNTKVHEDLKKKIESIPPLPSANGSYHLKATVSNGIVTYEWSTT